jgi:hypothetical protein
VAPPDRVVNAPSVGSGTVTHMSTKRWYGEEVAGLLLAGLSRDELLTAARRFDGVAEYLGAPHGELAGLRRVEPAALADNVWAVRRGEPGYPVGLAALDDPPLVLCGVGRFENLHERCLSILAERDASPLSQVGTAKVADAAPAGVLLGIDLTLPGGLGRVGWTADRRVLAVVSNIETLTAGEVDHIIAAGGTVITALGSRISAPTLLAAFASVVVTVEARRGGAATAAAVHAAVTGRTVLALRPKPAAWSLPGAQGLLELTRPDGARAEQLGVTVDEAVLNRRIPFADAVIERLEDLPELIGLAWAFRPGTQDVRA